MFATATSRTDRVAATMSQPLYKSWQGNNLFILGGRFMLGSSYRHLCITGASEAHLALTPAWLHARLSLSALRLTPTHANSRQLTPSHDNAG